MRRPWLTIPGVQDGERTLEEQLLGLAPALAEAPGRTVLDLGCAEGLIGQAFARAGALDVLGLEGMVEHVKVGQRNTRGVRFKVRDLNVQKPPKLPSWDIVLALAILHKLHDPARGVWYCARAARSLVVVRLPVGSTGLIAGKHSGVACDVRGEFVSHGFALERVEEGPRTELVQYWRRGQA